MSEVDVNLGDADRIFRSIKVESGFIAYFRLLNVLFIYCI